MIMTTNCTNSNYTEDCNKERIIVAAVEGGGTSFVVAVAEVTNATDPITILHRCNVDSSHNNPSETLKQCAAFLQCHQPTGGYHALGIASFGPVGLHRDQPLTYGCILATTPKAPWRNVNVLAPLQAACQGISRPLAVRVETDVNAPALAECHDDPQRSSLAYITVGTGVGVGLVIHRQCVHGRMHPEGGHVPVKPLHGDTFQGYSWGDMAPFHGKQTVEGIASSVALTERLEQMEGTQYKSRQILAELPDDHDIWNHAANAIANLCVTLLLTVSVEKIVLGGGVIQRHGLIKKIQDQTVALINGYIELPEDMATLITTSRYGDDAGIMGAIVLAKTAYEEDCLSGTGEDEKSLAAASMSSSSRDAFYQGLWHGAVVGGALVLAGYSLLSRPRRS